METQVPKDYVDPKVHRDLPVLMETLEMMALLGYREEMDRKDHRETLE